MNSGKSIFGQVIDFIPKREFRRLVEKYDGNKSIKSFSCWDQFLCMSFAQLTSRESLRDIETCLRAFGKKLYHVGIRGGVARSTIAYANNHRDWRIYQEFAQLLITEARELYIDEPFGAELDDTVYALDASVITLCLSMFPWAKYTDQKAGVKLHTKIDLRGNIPVFIAITEARYPDVTILDEILLEAGATYVMDKGYIDFKRLHRFTEEFAFFVIRARKDMVYRRLYSRHVEKSTGVRSDQIIALTDKNSLKNYPSKLRRIRYFDAKNKRFFTFLTNNLILPANIIADLYRCRWQIELFFKWIKQHLRIKAFYGTSENAVKTQIWIAISVYVLVAIMKKKLKIKHSLYTILQLLSVALFEKTPILAALSQFPFSNESQPHNNQLKLFKD